MSKPEKVKPIIIRNTETGEPEYTLEFNRKSIKNAERAGFSTDDLSRFPVTKVPELFWHAMRMHQPWMTMQKAEEIFDSIDGHHQEGLFARLIELYNEPMRAIRNDDAGDEKNSKYTLDM